MELYSRQLCRLMIKFGDEVLDAVAETTGVNVDDVRRQMLGPLRRQAHAHPPAPPS
jgi:hypothetical protein